MTAYTYNLLSLVRTNGPMQVKLTLRMDNSLIGRAKKYAAENGTSLSRMVANYFSLIVEREERALHEDEDWKKGLPPITRSLVGISDGSDLDEEDYYRYLEEKHR